MTSKSSGFPSVEGRAENYIDFLDQRTTIPDENAVKELILALLDLRDGLEVFDVGSGTGSDTIEVAKRVAPRGTVTGLDRSTDMVVEVRSRAAGWGTRVEFGEGDAHSLPFPDASFDRCRAERVLIHLADPAAAVGELVRVTRRGGIVGSHIDSGTMFLNSSNASLAEELARDVTDGLAQGRLGRRQQHYLVEAGMTDVRCIPRVIRNSVAFMRIIFAGPLQAMIATGTASAADAAQFWAELERGEREGCCAQGSSVSPSLGGSQAGRRRATAGNTGRHWSAVLPSWERPV